MNCIRIRLLIVVAVVLLIDLSAIAGRAAEPPSTFDAANKLYYEGKFTEAISAYETLVRSGQLSVAVYFNLGNAFFKSGQIGRAIAAYRQAQRFAPRDPDLRANLQFARNQTQGPTLLPTRWQRAAGKFTLNEWTLLASGSLWLFFLLFALVQWRPALRRPISGWLTGLALLTAVLCGCLAAAWRENFFTRTAIVIARDAVVHHGPLEESQNAFTVHDGAELRVLDQKDDWLQVSADARRIGWLRRDQVLFGRS